MANGNGWRKMLTPAILLGICLGVFGWLEGRVSAAEESQAEQRAVVREMDGKLSLLLDHFGIISVKRDTIIDTVFIIVPLGPATPIFDFGDSL